jgi:hypothetical protein
MPFGTLSWHATSVLCHPKGYARRYFVLACPSILCPGMPRWYFVLACPVGTFSWDARQYFVLACPVGTFSWDARQYFVIPMGMPRRYFVQLLRSSDYVPGTLYQYFVLPLCGSSYAPGSANLLLRSSGRPL